MRFADAFPQATEEQWRELVGTVLKGRDFEHSLVNLSHDGIRIHPLEQRRADARVVAGSSRDMVRVNCVRIEDPDVERASVHARQAVVGGAGILTLTFSGSSYARGFGLPDSSAATIDGVLRHVDCGAIGLRVETAPFAGRAVSSVIAELVKQRAIAADSADVDFGLQPIADFAMAGQMPLPFAKLMANAGQIVGQLIDQGFRGPFLRCDGRPFHEAGASQAQELAFVLAQAVSYLRDLGLSGFGKCLPDHISFTLAADVDQFLTIAKLRALRLLLARLFEVMGVQPNAAQIHAETAWRMMTKYDPHVNILRGAIAAAAAIMGGADSVSVLPLSLPLGLPDEQARQIARNTALVLMAESNLHRVSDPASGSGAIESLTETLCERAWALFQEIEAQRAADGSGVVAALANGFASRLLSTERDARLQAISDRRERMTGISEYALVREYPVDILARREQPEPTSTGLPSLRLSQPFEALRDRAAILSARNSPLKVFLAALGDVSEHTGRVNFAKGLFEAGGIEVIATDPAAHSAVDMRALMESFAASTADCVCLCASDQRYVEDGRAVVAALRSYGANVIFVAGRPRDLQGYFDPDTIDDFVFAGCNALALLNRALDHAEAAI